MRLLIFLLLALGRANRLPITSYCRVREAQFSYIFDFEKLIGKDDYSIKHDDDVLRLQLCKPLARDCNDQGGFSICLSKQNKEFGVGRDPPEVIVEFGEVIFKYTGEECINDKKYTANIKMVCDFAIKDGSGMEFAATTLDVNECEYNIIWRTNAACTPKREVNCTLDHNSNHYDLTKLINYSGNYEIPINKSLSIILNVCHSIVYGPKACFSHNGACLYDELKKNQLSKTLGEVGEKAKLVFDSNSGNLLLTYDDGAICDSTTSNNGHIKTTITFICNLNATESHPKYEGGMDKCHYNITWKTPSACSEQALRNKSLEKANYGACSVKDPVTNHMFNFTALMNKDFVVKLLATSEIYKFSICSPLQDTQCEKGSGACRLHMKKSGGLANNRLMWKESGPYLNYTNGHLCLGNQRKHTIIEFYCGDKYDYEIEDVKDLCYEVIKFSTNLACNKKKSNCATPKNEINLRPLIHQNENYMTNHYDEEFYLNVCQALIYKEQLKCENGAAACKAVIAKDKVINTINLGYPDDSPILTSERSALLSYRNGSICIENNQRRTETKISFVCDPYLSSLIQGKPEFLKYHNCTYYFNWKTNLACGKVDGVYKNNIITNTLGDQLDLSVLAMDKTSVYHVQNKKKNKMYKISFTNNINHCEGAIVCDNKINYGTKVSVLWDYSYNLIRLSTTEGSECGDGSLAQSTITIICNEETFSDEPVFVREETCNVEFEWYTNKICKTLDEQKFTRITTASDGEIVAVVLVIFFILLFICYMLDSTRRSRCLDVITNSTSRNWDRVKYSRVNTVEEVHLLLNTSDPTVIDSDSDDDLLEA